MDCDTFRTVDYFISGGANLVTIIHILIAIAVRFIKAAKFFKYALAGRP